MALTTASESTSQVTNFEPINFSSSLFSPVIQHFLLSLGLTQWFYCISEVMRNRNIFFVHIFTKKEKLILYFCNRFAWATEGLSPFTNQKIVYIKLRDWHPRVTFYVTNFNILSFPSSLVGTEKSHFLLSLDY